ncbi:hypothetical protein Aph01nite_52470 [Acrocarpospora phusangensis]|uniref:Uncharacterized protein n=1 Tax=Acrocarpospora phusangensis TaxID=1070424 RepID=A0A919QIQ9_9ACTN|nr:hypothetical protein Aph01nite_52470 [Acrocarpospora phusangensis]
MPLETSICWAGRCCAYAWEAAAKGSTKAAQSVSVMTTAATMARLTAETVRRHRPVNAITDIDNPLIDKTRIHLRGD